MVKLYRTILIPFVLIGTGCNAFTSLDTPSGDVAILAAARACFDLGDFQCAADRYRTLELSTSTAILNQAYSEDAFEILAQNGITFAVFMSTVLASGTDAGALVTQLAGTLRTSATTNPLIVTTTSPTSYPTRAALFGAYQKSLKMEPGRSQGLIKFITATTLMAEILAEDASVDTTNNVGKLKQTNLVSDVTACKLSQGIPTIAQPTTGCEPPAGATLIDGATAITLSTATSLTTAPSLQMILATAGEIQSGINAMSSSGGISSATSSLASGILGQVIGTPAGSPLFRYTLINLKIGAEK